MLKAFLFLLLPFLLQASSYPDLKIFQLDDLEKHSDTTSKNRVIDYFKTLDSLKEFSMQEQLTRINFYLNQLRALPDIVTYKQDDYWGTPKEFLVCGYGDCEDYAIIKYFTLLKLGFEKKKLFITTSHEKFTGQSHMVLSYFESNDKPPLILDNLSYKILDLSKRVDLEPKIFINEEGSYKLDANNNLTRVGDIPQKFKELLQRIKKEG
jgi:predicted transglutaminase-like cysteine proteinase